MRRVTCFQAAGVGRAEIVDAALVEIDRDPTAASSKDGAPHVDFRETTVHFLLQDVVDPKHRAEFVPAVVRGKDPVVGPGLPMHCTAFVPMKAVDFNRIEAFACGVGVQGSAAVSS